MHLIVILLRWTLKFEDFILEAELLIEFLLIYESFLSCAIASSLFLLLVITVTIFITRVVVLLPEFHDMCTLFGGAFFLWLVDDCL